MKQIRRCSRRFFISLLLVSVFIPIFLISGGLKNLNSKASREHIEDLSTIKHRIDTQLSNAIKKEDTESLKEPELILYKDGDISSNVNYSSEIKSDQSGNANDNTNVMEINGTSVNKQDYKQFQQERPPSLPRREKHSIDAQLSNAIKEEDTESLKEPELILYKDGDISSSVNYSSEIKSNQSGNANDNTNAMEIIGTKQERPPSLSRREKHRIGAQLSNAIKEEDTYKDGNISSSVNYSSEIKSDQSGNASDNTNVMEINGTNVDKQDDKQIQQERSPSLSRREENKIEAQLSTAIDEEDTESLKEPELILYKDGHISSSVNYSSEIKSDQSGNANDNTNVMEINGTNVDKQDDKEIQQERLPSFSQQEEHKIEAHLSNAIDEEDTESLEEAELILYKDGDISSSVDQSGNANDNTNIMEINGTSMNKQDDEQIQQARPPSLSRREEFSEQNITVRQNVQLQQAKEFPDEKVKEIRDQLIRAKAFYKFAQLGNNSQLVRELKPRIKELERSVGDVTKDSELSKGALKKSQVIEEALAKASRVYTDCTAMLSKLRGTTYNSEKQGMMMKKQISFLIQLAGRTTPRGLYCLSMRLTAEYFSLQPEDRIFPNQERLSDPNLYHFAVFSDNILACAVVLNSTISTFKEPEKIAFHIVTDSINLPAISMWFLLNPPVSSTIQIQSMDTFEGLFTKYGAALGQQNSHDPRFISGLNYLRFYLPDMFPFLNKIVLLDHDVIVQRDLTGLWDVSLDGKVNGAVETCHVGESVYRRMDTYLNFSDPEVAKKFDRKARTWAFGMNIFNLWEWRKRNLTRVYHEYLQMGHEKPLWKAGCLPLGWVTFYNHTVGLNSTWQTLGLGYDSGVKQEHIDRAAVLHFDGAMKPWSDLGLERYKDYWRRYVNYDHPYLQQCNIQR